jgi:DNA-binding MarR family transcriptional regulator
MDTATPDDPKPQPEPAIRSTLASSLASYTGYLLRRAYARAQTCAQQVLPPGTHPGEGAILTDLASRGPTSQQELSERLRVNRTIMVKLVDRLEAGGFVRRERNPHDRRAYALVVTPSGLEAIRAWGQAADRGEAMLVAGLTPAEHQRLNHLLGRLLPDLAETMPRTLVDRTGFLLSHAHFRLRQRGDQALASLGVEPRHFGALAALEELGPSPQQRLAREQGVSGPAIVAIVDDLERAGLVERQRNPHDRREYALRLTPTGRTRLRQAREALDALQAEVTAQLGEADDEELRAILRKLLTAPPIPATRHRRDTAGVHGEAEADAPGSPPPSPRSG